MDNPHIGLSYVESVLPDGADEFESRVANDNLVVKVQGHQSYGPMAGVELLLPTMVVAYLLKPYFESFLSEMGKDHYNALKSGLAWLGSKFIGSNASKITIAGTPGKLDPANEKYSLVFSIVAESSSGHRFKLLLQKDLKQEEYNHAIELFLEIMAEIHGLSEVNHLTEIGEVSITTGTILLAYQRDSKTLLSIDALPSDKK